MIVVLLYPPAQMIGETEEVEAEGTELVHVATATDAALDLVKFPHLGILSYFQDKFGRTMLAVQGIGPWSIKWGSWVGWRLPTADERRAWEQQRAAAAGLIAPGAPSAPGAKQGAPC